MSLNCQEQGSSSVQVEGNNVSSDYNLQEYQEILNRLAWLEWCLLENTTNDKFEG